ncbi:hypothetical protein [Pandoraea sp.]|uniref:hypothetical protein n=1 Tax=Pandoraea sp. TaxID=1883445 RepID=UPI0025D6687A|nr:hypothetical protein [Pandoraea sp.]
MKVEQIGDLAHSTAANPAQFNIGDLIHVAMTWRHNSWGFESCYFSVIAPGDGASYGFSDINGSCDRRDYPDGRVPKRGYEVIDTAKPLYAGELSLNLVPGQTYEAVTEIYPWRNTEPGVSSRYFKIRPLSGGVSTATPHKHVQGRVDITGAWRGNGATGTVKAWYKKDGVGPYILAGQGLGWFSLYNLPAGRQTLEFYVYYEGKFETYVGSKTVDVLAGGVTALRLEDKRLRVNGWVDGGVKQIKMETVWPEAIDLGTCAVSDGKFSCLSEKALRARWHDIRITASRGSTDLILLNRQHIDVTPSARWADDNPGIRLQGQPFRLAVDKGEEATHLQAYWRRGEKGLWHVSGDLKLDSDRSVVLPDTADWLPTDRSQYMVIFWVRRGSANWSPDSEIRSFQVKPLPPEWSKPPAGSAPGRKVSVTLRPPPGVDVVQPQWRREGGDWTDGQAVALQNTRTQDHTIAIAESAAWSSGHYDIRLRVRKNEGLWSEPSEAKSVVMRPSSPAGVFRDSTLTVFDQHGKPLMGGANVTVGDQITYRLKLAAASAAEQIDLSLSLAGAPQLQGQAGTLRYRAALSEQGDGAQPIDTTRLNKGWTGAGAAFGATTRLLVSGEDAPGMLAGKHAVIDIPVRVKAGAQGAIQVKAAGRANFVSQQDLAAPPLLIARIPVQDAMTVTFAPFAKDDRQPGEAVLYRVVLNAAKALSDVQLRYRLPAGLKQHGTPYFDTQSDLQQGLEATWDGSPQHSALLAPGAMLKAGRRAIIKIPLQVAPEAVDSRIDSRVEAAAGNVAGTAEARHTLRVIPDKTPDGGPLRLKTHVDKDNARPGGTLAYTIEFMNRSDQPLHELTIRELVPAHTTLVPQSAQCKQIPAALACRVEAPDEDNDMVGGAQIRWTFSGSLPPGERGTVGFKVRLER